MDTQNEVMYALPVRAPASAHEARFRGWFAWRVGNEDATKLRAVAGAARHYPGVTEVTLAVRGEFMPNDERRPFDAMIESTGIRLDATTGQARIAGRFYTGEVIETVPFGLLNLLDLRGGYHQYLIDHGCAPHEHPFVCRDWDWPTSAVTAFVARHRNAALAHWLGLARRLAQVA